MNYRIIGFAAIFVMSLTAADQKARKSQSNIPRTPDGHPSMEGIWTNVTITPLERPKDLEGKNFSPGRTEDVPTVVEGWRGG